MNNMSADLDLKTFFIRNNSDWSHISYDLPPPPQKPTTPPFMMPEPPFIMTEEQHTRNTPEVESDSSTFDWDENKHQIISKQFYKKKDFAIVIAVLIFTISLLLVIVCLARVLRSAGWKRVEGISSGMLSELSAIKGGLVVLADRQQQQLLQQQQQQRSEEFQRLDLKSAVRKVRFPQRVVSADAGELESPTLVVDTEKSKKVSYFLITKN